eukprot:TRINITY_DN16050_c0_g1_i1.p1 TRINITY_DN16050_c0_g1~~TRINITY_DN16050_c0_g1_i1.p1  ORF type:complete len:125 (+),score=29.34 TRINITY_DN16050_c0_g1_i1:176-550(+)
MCIRDKQHTAPAVDVTPYDHHQMSVPQPTPPPETSDTLQQQHSTDQQLRVDQHQLHMRYTDQQLQQMHHPQQMQASMVGQQPPPNFQQIHQQSTNPQLAYAQLQQLQMQQHLSLIHISEPTRPY